MTTMRAALERIAGGLTDDPQRTAQEALRAADRLILVAPPAAPGLAGEAGVQAAIRIEMARRGIAMWRNNVGAMVDHKGRQVRYGLANDSRAVNEKVKSADLIGITPVRITAEHVGSTIGRFTSIECKAPGWRYAGTAREAAQMQWAEIVNGLGGDATFATGMGVSDDL